jgi:Tfp pilus assembly protein PilP
VKYLIEPDLLEPDPTRPTEHLEGFALDALQLAAIMILEGKLQLIVVTPDGVIHQVVEGAYLGQNYGQITEIDLEGRSVGLAEVIKGADGRWQERTVKYLIEPDLLEPDPTRPTEHLEGFALDALQLAAIMILEGKLQLIVVTPDGVIHQVVEGAYLGQNYGQITEIDLEGRSVGLAEVIKGADGRWQERTVKYLIGN